MSRISPDTAQAVKARAGNRCELNGVGACVGRLVLHHRMGKKHNRACDLLHLCETHHVEVHAHPSSSYVRGWMVRRGDVTPASAVPVRFIDGRFLLHPDGSRTKLTMKGENG